MCRYLSLHHIGMHLSDRRVRAAYPDKLIKRAGRRHPPRALGNHFPSQFPTGSKHAM